MKKILLLTVALFMLSSAFAQKDKKAELILSKVSDTYKAYDSFRIKFSITVENKEADIKDTSHGVADIKKDKYKISLMGAETYFDGKTRYTYLVDSNELNITEPQDDADELTNPSKIFSLYKNGFSYYYVKEYKKAGKTIVELKLVPKAKKEYTSVNVLVNKANNQVLSFSSKGRDGNNLIINMDSLDTKQSFSDKYFVFDKSKHSKVEVIDMR